MAGVAQLVRATVCGTVGRGFKPHHSPQELSFEHSAIVSKGVLSSNLIFPSFNRRFESTKSTNCRFWLMRTLTKQRIWTH